MTRPEPYLGRDVRLTGKPLFVRAFDDSSAPRRTRSQQVRLACAVTRVLCGLFAVVLLAQIVLVTTGANPANDIAVFVRVWASSVSLGFEDLFTPANAAWRVFLNYTPAAFTWVVLAPLLTMLIRRFGFPRGTGDRS
ncbi:hypothetical protein [Amycolatopsis sp. CA-230715]|uniref:hypothetical protein n=1 Tax=Amycolatopsis sp. CA-230715 TaxID=2745196 RepID=UPI001C025522|nr:hypothetical protein [Amycolatopsis sp. CA-230715]QWF83994.1 hypothetical protein HUW46_07438 [Amycolatopsis sp. CA-230715]